jgi:hypothetical protein
MVAMPLSNSYCTEVRWLIKRLECLRGINHYYAADKKYIPLPKKLLMGGTHKGVTCWARDNLIKSILRVMGHKLFQSSIHSSRELRKQLEGTVHEPCRLTKVLVIIFTYMRLRIEA